MNVAIREELISLSARDGVVRAELAAEGTLFDGYHPRMAEVHRANAERLREIIALYGWPGRSLVGDDGADAAWRIAQHSIGEPAFMRTCRALLDAASHEGDAPRLHFAFIDDRIRAYEGTPQRYGTQLRGDASGLDPYPLEDPARVEEWRREVGLPPLGGILRGVRENPPPDARDQAACDAAEDAWRRAVGWTHGG